MAGSYRHVTNEDGSFAGVERLDHLGDAYEALEEMHDMIRILSGGDRVRIEHASLAAIRERREASSASLNSKLTRRR